MDENEKEYTNGEKASIVMKTIGVLVSVVSGILTISAVGVFAAGGGGMVWLAIIAVVSLIVVIVLLVLLVVYRKKDTDDIAMRCFGTTNKEQQEQMLADMRWEILKQTGEHELQKRLERSYNLSGGAIWRTTKHTMLQRELDIVVQNKTS